MSWEIALQTLLERGQGQRRVEYGVFQLDSLRGTPLWRRPTRGETLHFRC